MRIGDGTIGDTKLRWRERTIDSILTIIELTNSASYGTRGTEVETTRSPTSDDCIGAGGQGQEEKVCSHFQL